MRTPQASRVLVLARKPLLSNARIFKQVKSLLDAGYEVDVVGLETVETAARRSSDPAGLDPRARVYRVPFNPLHARLYRAARRARGLEAERVAPGGVPPPVNPPRALERLVGPLLWPLRSLDWNARAYRLARTLARPDVVHCNDLDTLIVGLAIARRGGSRLVYDAQELYAEQHILPRWYSRLLRVQERVLIGKADRVVAVNEAIAEVLEQRYGRAVDAVVLNAASRHENHAPTVREAAGVPEEMPLLVYSGGLLPDRGLEQTISALHHLPGWTLAIVGEGPSRSDLARLAERMGLAERVRFLDYVPHERVPSFLASADVGVIPYTRVDLNRLLSSPSKLFHYIAAELPIVCSDLPFLRGIVEEYGIGAVFDSERPESLATAVQRVARDSGSAELKARLAQAADRFRWEEEEERFLRVYESLESS